MLYSKIDKKLKIAIITIAFFAHFHAEAGIWSFFARIKALILNTLKRSSTPKLEPQLNQRGSSIDDEINVFVALFCSKIESLGITGNIYNYSIKNKLTDCLASAPNRFPSGDVIAALNILAVNTFYRAYFIATTNPEIKLPTVQCLQIATEESDAIYKKSSELLNKIHCLDEISNTFLANLSDKNIESRILNRIRSMQQAMQTENPPFNPYYNPLYPSI